MTKLSTNWAGVHRAGVLRVSWGSLLTEGADVLRAVGVYVVQRLALGALYDSGVGWFRSVRDDDGVVAGSGLHNHLQSSGEDRKSTV